MKAILLLVLLVFIAGCAQSGPADTNDIEEKVQITETTQPPAPKTEITVTQLGTRLIISPSIDKEIGGVVTLTVTEVPEGTTSIGFAISGLGIEDISATGPNIFTDSDGSDGWESIFDTSRYDNGVYDISGMAFPESGGAPLGAATAQVVIQN